MEHFSTRFIVVKLLDRWEKDDIYINIVLNKYLKSRKIEERDKRFITELLNGVVKNKLRLDWIIDSLSDFTLQVTVRNILRVALYQMIFMDSVPFFAAVNEAVNTAKKMRLYSSTRLINGILRSFIRNKDNIKYPLDTVSFLSTFYSHPRFMVERYVKRFGEENSKRIFEVNNGPIPIALRINILKFSSDKVKTFLKEEGIEFEEGKFVDTIIYVKRLKDVLKYVNEGILSVQDESSAMVSKILAPKQKARIWDMCSAPGGKVTHVAELVNDKASIIATDVYANRLSIVKSNIERLGISSVTVLQEDASVYKDKEKFDYILLDAPCTGTGVLRRKSDLRWRFNKDNLYSMVKIQKKLVDNAMVNLKENGVFVYSTCSIEEEENEKIVEYILAKYPYMKIDLNVNFPYNTKKSGYFHIQEINGPDGGFAVRLKKEVQ